MKKILDTKTAILVLGGLSIPVLIYLIASLGGLELKPAKPFAYVQDTNAVSPGGLPSWNGLAFVIVFFVASMIILYLFLPPEMKKKFLKGLVWFALAGIVTLLILSSLSRGEPVQPQQETPGEVFITRVPETTPSVFTPPQVSSWTAYLVTLVILLVVAALWVWLVWRKRKMGAPYELLAEIAQSGLDDIDAGKDWGDTILNSYYRMNKAVDDWRGIRRRVSMTPAEFAEYLVSSHLPGAAVNNLTALFERVRYGEKKSTSKDIQEAVDCLTAILNYCAGAK
jgi:hypothetical protein